jgi:glucan phosphoethanolaminetransferase (alkaline phosphatase superfamily)
MLFEINFSILTLAFVIFSFFSILYLLQLRRTAQRIEEILHSLNKILPGILTKVDSIAANIADASQILKNQASSLSYSLDKIQNMVDEIILFERMLKKEIETPVMQTIGTGNAILSGVRAFLLTFFSRS